MSGLAIHALTLGAVGMMLDLESVNKLLDVVIPCYTILVIIVIAAFVRHNKDQKEDVDAIPVYTWNKSKAPQVEIPWKDQLLGNWDLAAPRGEPFKKWLMFNGAPSFIASMNENNHTSMHIEKGETGDKMYTLAFNGTPVVNWTNNFVGDSNEQAKKEPQDNHKRFYSASAKSWSDVFHWFDESNKSLTSEWKQVNKINGKEYVIQISRTIDPNDINMCNNVLIGWKLADPGKTISFSFNFKRIK